MFPSVDGYSVKKTRERLTKEIKTEVIQERNIEMAREMLLNDEPIEKMAKYSNLTKSRIKELQKELKIK